MHRAPILLCMGLLLLACMALVSAQAPAPAPTLCVSTSEAIPLTCDVVNGGVVTPAYADPNQPFIFNNTANPLSGFWVALTAAGDPLSPTGCWNVSGTAVMPDGTCPQNVEARYQQPSRLGYFGQCQYPGGEALLSFSMDFDGQFAGVTFYYKRVCTFPVIQMGTHTGDSDVVLDGFTVADWSGWVFSKNQSTQQNFYLTLTNTEPGFYQPFNFHVFTTDINMTLTTNFIPWDFNIREQQILQMQVNTSCNGAVNPYPPIFIEITYGWSVSIKSNYSITCVTEPFLTGFYVASSQTLAAGNNWDVVQQGEAVAQWASSDGFKYGTNAWRYNTLWFSGAQLGTDQVVNIEYNTVDPSVYQVMDFSSGQILVPAGQAVPYTMVLTCFSPGTTRTRMELRVDPYATIPLTFAYSCQTPSINIGASPVGTEMVQQGVETQVWQSGNVTLDSNSAQSLFFIYLDATSPVPYQWYSATASADPNIMTVSVQDPNMGNATFTSPQLQPVTVSYQCKVTAKAVPIRLVVSYGWATEYTLLWSKDCVVSSSGGGGWNPAAIFFFTLFMLGLFLCLLGCGYNYVHEEKRGLAIVPCYPTMRACYERMLGPRRYGPQSDDYGSGGGYGSYNDVSDNYQSNL